MAQQQSEYRFNFTSHKGGKTHTLRVQTTNTTCATGRSMAPCCCTSYFVYSTLLEKQTVQILDELEGGYWGELVKILKEMYLRSVVLINKGTFELI